LWDWIDERRYAFHLYITRETPVGWQTHHGVSVYRAVLRDELTRILEGIGFVKVRWCRLRVDFTSRLFYAWRETKTIADGHATSPVLPLIVMVRPEKAPRM
jgi:hypothetical protein